MVRGSCTLGKHVRVEATRVVRGLRILRLRPHFEAISHTPKVVYPQDPLSL